MGQTCCSKAMFSGLIERVGKVADVEPIPAGLRIRIATGLAAELSVGDSVAVNGVCLTVANLDDAGFWAKVSPETARVTTLGRVGSEGVVNLERALRADARLGGHFVLGHVDDVGHIDAIAQQTEFYRVTLRYPRAVDAYIVQKGSIAVDGISLTVARLERGRFDVQIVPYTWEHTNLRAARVDDPVNLECDIIGKYVVRALDAVRDAGPSAPPAGDEDSA